MGATVSPNVSLPFGKNPRAPNKPLRSRRLQLRRRNPRKTSICPLGFVTVGASKFPRYEKKCFLRFITFVSNCSESVCGSDSKCECGYFCLYSGDGRVGNFEQFRLSRSF